MTTRAKHLIPALLAIAILAAACGSPASEGRGSDASGGGSSGDPGAGGGTTCPSPEAGKSPDCPVSSTHDPIVIDPGDAATARPVEITPGLEDTYMTAFDEHRVVDGDRLKLFFWGGVEGCYGVDHVDIEYGKEAVTATIFYGNKPDADVCIEIAEYQVVTVQLDEPLGGRDVVDGARAAS